MTVRSKAFQAQRYRVIIDGHTFIIAKGASQYARWYVLDEDGKYLTSGSKGKSSYEAALDDARIIAAQRGSAAMVSV